MGRMFEAVFYDARSGTLDEVELRVRTSADATRTLRVVACRAHMAEMAACTHWMQPDPILGWVVYQAMPGVRYEFLRAFLTQEAAVMWMMHQHG